MYLPKEKIVVAGDLVVYPIPYIYDGYPSEWIQTLQNLAQLDADTIVPGHGPIMHDKTYLFLAPGFVEECGGPNECEAHAKRPSNVSHSR